MRWIVGIAVAPIFLFHTGGPVVCAQKQQAQPPAYNAEAPRPYVSPSASKSVEIGDYYLRRKKFTAALSRFQEALKTDPHYAPAYQELGKLYERTGPPQKALDAYRKYLDELPSAQAARESKRTHKAIARLEKQLPSGGQSSGSQSTRQ
jgi:tetratricopeptide (TPR) repeat protein